MRQHLVQLIEGGHAHATFEDAVRDMPLDKVGTRPEGAPQSAWELLEHLRIAQKDILEFSRSAGWVSPKWPEGYWPASPRPEKPEQWTHSVKSYLHDRAQFIQMLQDENRSLTEPFPWGDGQTLLREALLIADHASYHLGQLVLVRRLLGAWR
jgi:uncharacterized damage-inducible protein DinB